MCEFTRPTSSFLALLEARRQGQGRHLEAHSRIIFLGAQGQWEEERGQEAARKVSGTMRVAVGGTGRGVQTAGARGWACQGLQGRRLPDGEAGPGDGDLLSLSLHS